MDKVWLIMLQDENDKWLIRVYSKKTEAVAEMKWLYDQHIKDSPNAVIDLKESDDTMVITLCDDDFNINDKAVMMEHIVDGFQEIESETRRPCIPFNGCHYKYINEKVPQSNCNAANSCIDDYMNDLAF